MKFQLFFILLVICSSCVKYKNYEYIEVVEENSITTEKTPEKISALSDSIAYLQAFRKFCISYVLYQNSIIESMKSDNVRSVYVSPKPIIFKLCNEDGEDICHTVSFITKEQEEYKIYNEIKDKFLIDNYDSYLNENQGTKYYSRIDSAKIKELLPFFNQKRDEFDPVGLTWIIPKSAPKYINMNGVYIYFGALDANPTFPAVLRLKLQYCADDWLFIEKIQFLIDGNLFKIIPQEVKRDNNGGKIWEWCDEPIDDKDFVDALENAKSIKIKLIGDNYNDIMTLSEKQVTDIRRSISLYRAMGGFK